MEKLQLYIVPFAGGCSYSFKHIVPLLEDVFEVHAWDGPGKGVNSGQVKNEHFMDEARSFADYVKEHSRGRQYCTWGYSCGGLICYEAMRLLQAQGIPMPKRVFLSAVRPAAEFITPDTKPMTDEELLSFLNDMSVGDNTISLLKNIDDIRRDMELASDYRYMDTGKVDAPASVMYADDDFVTETGVKNWKNYFTGEVSFAVFHGRHFFYRYQPQELADYIKSQGSQ